MGVFSFLRGRSSKVQNAQTGNTGVGTGSCSPWHSNRIGSAKAFAGRIFFKHYKRKELNVETPTDRII